KLDALAAAASNFQMPAVSVPVSLPKLNLAIAAGLHLDLIPMLSVRLPSLALTFPSAGPIQAAGLAVTQFKAAFGLSLFDLPPLTIPLLDNMLAANGPALMSIPTPSLGAMLNLSAMLSLALTLKVGLGLDPLKLDLTQSLAGLLAPLSVG